MRQRIFAGCTSALRELAAGKVLSQYLVGSGSPSGHSMSSHCSVRGALRVWSRCAARTRTAAKRERNSSLVPSRQASVR